MLLTPIALWEALAFLFVGVSGVAVGIGWKWVSAELSKREIIAELDASWARKLEIAIIKQNARYSAEMADLRTDVATARQDAHHARNEAQMQAQTTLAWQRRVEDLEKQLHSGITINAGNDANIAGDFAGRDHISGAQ